MTGGGGEEGIDDVGDEDFGVGRERNEGVDKDFAWGRRRRRR